MRPTFWNTRPSFWNRVNDHCARNASIKVLLWIVVLWMLVPSKYFIKTTNSFKNTYNKCNAGLQHGISPVVSFLACIFSCKVITFNSNWSKNSPRETAVDIALGVSENSNANVDSEVLSKVLAYEHGVCCSFFQVKTFPRSSEHRSAF